jgi:hypothetical protein
MGMSGISKSQGIDAWLKAILDRPIEGDWLFV